MLNQKLIKDKISQARQELPSLKIKDTEKQQYMHEIQELLKHNNACLVAHYYVDAEIQELAEKQVVLLAIRLQWQSLVLKVNVILSWLRVLDLWVILLRS